MLNRRTERLAQSISLFDEVSHHINEHFFS